MAAPWERNLERWLKAELIDNVTAERIRGYESERARSRGLRWPVLLALAFGGIAIGAGVLLFVAAHWDDLSPAGRFVLVLLMVAAFHISGALAGDRFKALTITLHAVGTIALGAGIFLAGQIFNLQEHWPGGVLLWSVGAWIAWAIRRDWVQATLAALLTPAWLVGEWMVATEGSYEAGSRILYSGILLLAITYLTALTNEKSGLIRRALAEIGAISCIPCTLLLAVESGQRVWWGREAFSVSTAIFGWTAAFALPLILAVVLRGKRAWMNLVSAVWVLGLGAAASRTSEAVGFHYAWHVLGPYLLGGLGSVGLVAWGIWEMRKERVNLGVAGFALTVLIFYFATVMDKLGRSVSLIGLGVLFLLGGWELERLRRRLVAKVTEMRT